MIRFYIARVFAYLVARLVIPAIWWFYPKSLLPLIEFNGRWVRKALEYLLAKVPASWESWSGAIRDFLYVTDKVGEAIQWTLRLYVSAEARDHVEVLARALLTPGGWLMLAQLTSVIFVMIVVWQKLHKRRESKTERVEHQSETP